MEKEVFDEKESLKIISQMIENTKRRLEKGQGIPFLVWGYTATLVTVAVLLLVMWSNSFVWFWGMWAIPVIGWPLTFLLQKKQEKGAVTYLDKMINYVWIVVGISIVITLLVKSLFLCYIFPAEGPCACDNLMYVSQFTSIWLTPTIKLLGVGCAITGLMIKERFLTIIGFLSILVFPMVLEWVSLRCGLLTVMLIFALIFVMIMIVPGHILNHRAKKNHV